MLTKRKEAMQRWRLELSVFCGYFSHQFPFQKVTPVTWHEICLLQNNILIFLGLYSTMVKETFLMLRFFHAYPAPLETDACPLTSSPAVTPYQVSSLMTSLSKFGQLKQNSHFLRSTPLHTITLKITYFKIMKFVGHSDLHCCDI